jgi:hypothetical protein
VEKLESIDDVNEDNDGESGEPEPPPKPAATSVKRNLTAEALKGWCKNKRAEELSKVKPGETVKIHLPKLDKGGNPVKDAHGYTVTEERTVLKAEQVAKKWDSKLDVNQE